MEENTRRVRLTDPLPAPYMITVDHYGDMRPRAAEVFIEILKGYFSEAYFHH